MNQGIRNTIINMLIVCSIGLNFQACVDDGPRPADKIDAYVYHKYFIKDKLKSPTTAEFSSYNKNKIRQLDKFTFKLTGYVDSQNSFGAQIRTNYTIVVKNETGEVKDWKLISLDI